MVGKGSDRAVKGTKTVANEGRKGSKKGQKELKGVQKEPKKGHAGSVCVPVAAVRWLELGSGSDTVSCEESGPGRPGLSPPERRRSRHALLS